jgi:flavorubredoxin
MFRQAAQRIAAHPWVEEVRMRRLFPRSVAILVKEWEPVAFFSAGNRSVYVDAKGILEIIEKEKVPWFTSIASAPPITRPVKPFIFRAGVNPTDLQARTMAIAGVEYLKGKKIGVFTMSDEYGVYFRDNIKKYLDEKNVLVDTVKAPFYLEMLGRISEIIDPSKIDIIISNHVEMDHSSSLPQIIERIGNPVVITSERGKKGLEKHYQKSFKMKTVKTGDTISLGHRTLAFVEAPMLHWPDSMFTYIQEDRVLLPNDAFGQHYASSVRFNDQVDLTEVYEEAIKYYANILTPFSPLVLKKIEEVLALNLPVAMIAPSHGVIWRNNPLQIVRKYQEWSSQRPEKSAVVIYDTMWDGTRYMAEAIGQGIATEGIPYKIFHVGVSDRNDIVTEIFKSKAVIVGSPTFNQGVLPTMTPILENIEREISTKDKKYILVLSDYTPEAIVKYFNSRKKIYFLGLLAKDEKTIKPLRDSRKMGRSIPLKTVRRVSSPAMEASLSPMSGRTFVAPSIDARYAYRSFLFT